jgi:hypothetical protein
MTINVTDESDTYLAGWWVRKGERYISSWLTIDQRQYNWFDREMIKRFGINWREDQEKE